MRLLLVISLTLLCLAQSGAAPGAERAEIQELYRRGLSGDKAAVTECIAKLEALLKTDGGNQLARVYLGSALTLRSRDLAFGPTKLQVLRRGVAVMDEAVAAAPTDPKIRLARALTTSALPAILGYRAASRRDFEELAAMAGRQPDKFEPGDLQIVYYNAGLVAKDAGDKDRATECWRQARQHSVDPGLAAKVNTELAKLR